MDVAGLELDGSGFYSDGERLYDSSIGRHLTPSRLKLSANLYQSKGGSLNEEQRILFERFRKLAREGRLPQDAADFYKKSNRFRDIVHRYIGRDKIGGGGKSNPDLQEEDLNQALESAWDMYGEHSRKRSDATSLPGGWQVVPVAPSPTFAEGPLNETNSLTPSVNWGMFAVGVALLAGAVVVAVVTSGGGTPVSVKMAAVGVMLLGSAYAFERTAPRGRQL